MPCSSASGVATALLTTAGFADVLVIGRQNRPHLYRLYQQPPASAGRRPLRWRSMSAWTPKAMWCSRSTKLPGCGGEQLRSGGARKPRHRLLVFLSQSTHERRAAELLHQLLPDLPISLSSEVLPEYREYERTATTLINAYVQPLVPAIWSAWSKHCRMRPCAPCASCSQWRGHRACVRPPTTPLALSSADPPGVPSAPLPLPE